MISQLIFIFGLCQGHQTEDYTRLEAEQIALQNDWYDGKTLRPIPEKVDQVEKLLRAVRAQYPEVRHIIYPKDWVTGYSFVMWLDKDGPQEMVELESWARQYGGKVIYEHKPNLPTTAIFTFTPLVHVKSIREKRFDFVKGYGEYNGSGRYHPKYQDKNYSIGVEKDGDSWKIGFYCYLTDKQDKTLISRKDHFIFRVSDDGTVKKIKENQGREIYIDYE